MKAHDRVRLTTTLRDHVAKVAEDLRAKMRSERAVRERAKKLHTDEQVGEELDVWTDRRPLDADQLRYAALDAEVLLGLYERFAASSSTEGHL